MKKNALLASGTDSVATAQISHLDLKPRFGAALVAGCLALSLAPCAAFAAPMEDGGFQQGGAPAAMQEGSQSGGEMPGGAPMGQTQGGAMGQEPGGQQAPSDDFGPQTPSEPIASNGFGEQQPSGDAPAGQAPDGQMTPGQQAPSDELPSGQAPNGQTAPNGQAPLAQMPDQQNGETSWQQVPGNPTGDQPRTDATDDQVRQALADSYGIETSMPNGQAGDAAATPGAPGEAPDLPEGAVNVQQIIDAMRDVLRFFSGDDLASRIGDADFAAELQAYAKSATEQRLAAFASGDAPAMQNAPANTPADNAAVSANDSALPTGMPATPAAPANGEAAPANAPAAPAEAAQSVSASVFDQILSIIMGAFGYTTAA